MVDSAMIEKALKQVLPKNTSALIPELAELLTQAANNDLSPEEFQEAFINNNEVQKLIKALSGKSISSENTVISFGRENQFGDVTVRDVAAGNIIHLTMNSESLEKDRDQKFYSYFDRMYSQIDKLGNSNSARYIPIIKTLTIATLRSLDAERNQQIMLFLQESHITQKVDNILNLEQGLLFGAVLGKVDLSGASLIGADLRNADLREVNLENADLRGADISGAKLQGAVLRNANLIQANLNGADLRTSDLSNAILDNTELEKANLRGATLNNAKIYNSNLRKAILNSCDMFQAEIINSDLAGVDFRRTKLINASVREANFRNIFCKYSDFSLSEFINVDFESAYLRLMSFKGIVLIPEEVGTIIVRKGQIVPLTTGAKNVEGRALFRSVNFTNTSIHSVNFSGATFENTSLDNVAEMSDSTVVPDEIIAQQASDPTTNN